MTRLREKRACPSPNTSGCSAQTRLGGLTPLALTLAALLAALACADAAFARRPSRRNNAAAAAAAKKKAVASIRAQIAAAQQVLASAEAAGYASQGQLEEIRKRVSAAREAMAEAVDEEREARQHLREVETALLEAQSPESEFGRAQTRYVAARTTVEDFRKRYGDDRDGLKFDPQYGAAVEALSDAKREQDRIRTDLLAKNQEWQAASQELRDVAAERREKQQAGVGSLGMMSASRNLRNAEEIAAAARQVIAVGEARLRQMGEKVSPERTTGVR